MYTKQNFKQKVIFYIQQITDLEKLREKKIHSSLKVLAQSSGNGNNACR